MREKLMEMMNARHRSLGPKQTQRWVDFWLSRGFLMTSDLMVLYEIKKSTATKWCREGFIPARKLSRDWLVRLDAVQAFVPPVRRGRYTKRS